MEKNADGLLLDTGEAKAHGVIKGQVSIVPGRGGKVLMLDGQTGYVLLNGGEKLHLTDYTIMAWAYAQSSGFDPLRMEILEKTNAYWLNRRFDSGKVRLGSFVGPHLPKTKWDFLDSEIAFPLGRWIHVAGTHNSTGFRIYFNGKEVAFRKPSEPGVEQNNGPLTVGAKMNFDRSVVAWWHGMLDDVRLFSQALSATEIQDWMTR